jgi:hypothetical protein
MLYNAVWLPSTYRHNVVRDCLLRMAKELQLQVGKEPPLPVGAQHAASGFSG